MLLKNFLGIKKRPGAASLKSIFQTGQTVMISFSLTVKTPSIFLM